MPRKETPSNLTTQVGDLTLHMSLELSQATWLVTALASSSDKMSKHTTLGGDGTKLIELINRLRAKAGHRSSELVPIIAIQ